MPLHSHTATQPPPAAAKSHGRGESIRTLLRPCWSWCWLPPRTAARATRWWGPGPGPRSLTPSQAGARAVTRVGDTRRHGSQLDADASNVDCAQDRAVSPASIMGHSAVVDTWNAVTGSSVPDYHRSEDYGPAWTWGTPTIHRP